MIVFFNREMRVYPYNNIHKEKNVEYRFYDHYIVLMDSDRVRAIKAKSRGHKFGFVQTNKPLRYAEVTKKSK